MTRTVTIFSPDDLAAVPSDQRAACKRAFEAWASHRQAIKQLGETEFGNFAGCVAMDLKAIGDAFVWHAEEVAA